MRIRTLLVDDSPETLDALSLLYAMNPVVDVVGRTKNAAETLSLLKSTSVDLVSLDIHLGSDNGLELCSQIYERHPSVFISICSLEEDEAYRVLAKQCGAHYFLAKPITSDDIDHLVRHIQQIQACGEHDLVPKSLDESNWIEQILKNDT